MMSIDIDRPSAYGFLTYKNLILTLWARDFLQISTDKLKPISKNEFKPFFDQLLPGLPADGRSKRRKITRQMKQNFLDWLTADTGLKDIEISARLGQTLENLFEEIESELDRVTGKITLARPEDDVELIETIEFPGWGNRFASYVFPALRERMAGQPCEHPGLEEGWRVQRFTDAAAQSAQRGAWVELAELDA